MIYYVYRYASKVHEAIWIWAYNSCGSLLKRDIRMQFKSKIAIEVARRLQEQIGVVCEVHELVFWEIASYKKQY